MSELSQEAISVIDKVKKLLALANGNQNENEAASATAKAMALLEAYNLDMAIVGSTAKSGQRKDNKLKGGLYGWQRSLWQSVSELNFCFYWSLKGLAKGSTYEHRILGGEANVASATLMAEYLQQTVERLTREYAKTAFPGYSIFTRELIAYREGMADRLSARLAGLRRERQQAEKQNRPAGSTANALVLADVINSEYDANCDFLYGYEPGTSARRRAEATVRQQAAMRAAEESLAARDEDERQHPEKKAARLAAEKKEYDAWSKKWEKAANRPERERAMSAAEQRRNLSTYDAGYSKANDIGLDGQVDHDKKHRLGVTT